MAKLAQQIRVYNNGRIGQLNAALARARIAIETAQTAIVHFRDLEVADRLLNSAACALAVAMVRSSELNGHGERRIKKVNLAITEITAIVDCAHRLELC